MKIEIVKAGRVDIDERSIMNDYADLRRDLQFVSMGRHLASPEEIGKLLSGIRYLDLLYFIHKGTHLEGIT